MILDAIITIIALYFAITGYTRGFIKSALAMIKVSTSVIVAIILSRPVAAFLNKIFGFAKTCASIFKTSESNGNLILIAIVIILIFIGIRIVLRLFNKMATSAKKNRIVNEADSLLGFLFGLLHFCFIFFILSAVVYIITALPFANGLHDWLFSKSVVGLWLYNTATDLLFVKILGAFSKALNL